MYRRSPHHCDGVSPTNRRTHRRGETGRTAAHPSCAGRLLGQVGEPCAGNGDDSAVIARLAHGVLTETDHDGQVDGWH